MGHSVAAKREIPIPPLSHADIAFHVIGVALNWSCTLWGLVWLFTAGNTYAPSWPILVGVVLIGDRTTYLWGNEARSHAPPTQGYNLLIFQRRESG